MSRSSMYVLDIDDSSMIKRLVCDVNGKKCYILRKVSPFA